MNRFHFEFGLALNLLLNLTQTGRAALPAALEASKITVYSMTTHTKAMPLTLPMAPVALTRMQVIKGNELPRQAVPRAPNHWHGLRW